jgi:hypothetical protein
MSMKIGPTMGMAGLPKARPLGAAGRAAEALDRVSVGQTANGTASGWVGNQGLSASIRQDDQGADVDGWMGGASFTLHESSFGSSASIDGWIRRSGGVESVGINVSRTGSGDQSDVWYSGYIGRDFVNLHESSDERQGQVFGTVGNRSVSITRSSDENGTVQYSGSIFGSGQGGFVGVQASFDHPVEECEPLVALLAGAR